MHKALRALGRARRALDEVSRPRSGLWTLPEPETTVCRCEELTRHEVDEAIDAGSHTQRALKVATRLCMGPCQGRMCWPFMSRYAASRVGMDVETVGPLSIRPPLKPISLGEMARRPGLTP